MTLCLRLSRNRPSVGSISELFRTATFLPLSATVRASHLYPTVRLAFEFLVLTAVRSAEALGARWSEVNHETRTWVVPAERHKTRSRT